MSNRTVSALLAAVVLTVGSQAHADDFNVVYPFPLTSGTVSLQILPQIEDCFRTNGDKLTIHYKPGGDMMVGAKFAIDNGFSLISNITGKDAVTSDEVKALLATTTWDRSPIIFYKNIGIKSRQKVKPGVTFISTSSDKGATGLFARELASELGIKDAEYIYMPATGERIKYVISNFVDYAIVTDGEDIRAMSKEGLFELVDLDFHGMMWLFSKSKVLETKIKSCLATQVKFPFSTGVPRRNMVDAYKKRFHVTD